MLQPKSKKFFPKKVILTKLKVLFPGRTVLSLNWNCSFCVWKTKKISAAVHRHSRRFSAGDKFTKLWGKKWHGTVLELCNQRRKVSLTGCGCSCGSLPLDWCRTPRAGTRRRCCTSPSGTGWRRTAPPTGCSTASPRSRRSPRAQIWSTPWPRRRCTPSCPDRGRTVLPKAWRSLCGEPVYRQRRLDQTKTRSHIRVCCIPTQHFKSFCL